MKRNNFVTHYTSNGGFESIINNSKLWFTDIDFLNDYHERQLAIDELKTRCSFAENEDVWSNEHIQKVQQKMYNSIDLAFESKRAFILSCSSLRDDLAMWNYYSKNSPAGGYNFSFNIYDLAISIAAHLDKCGIKYNLLVGKVYYSKTKLKKIAGACEDFMNEIYAHNFRKYPLSKKLHIFNERLDEGLPIDEVEASFLVDHILEAMVEHGQLMHDVIKEAEVKSENIKLDERVHCDIKKYAEGVFKNDPFAFDCFFKNKSFSFEKEYRLVIQVNQKELEKLIDFGICKTRYNHELDIPYLEIEFNPSIIQRVCIAPTNKDIGRVEHVRKLLDRHNPDAEIISSKIPVRY